ncbi:LysR family transcriptional regulator [Streptomyces sp. NPDC050161]|uniref:LysR family transcriptional regulator n=1 Tax=Streptomyces sp. NPDC050161 TaxID=3365604 RepID=UPI0037AC3009
MDLEHVELRVLRGFFALAEEEHFSVAAARCRVSQPTLSRMVASLERDLGVRLVERTTRSVSLTAVGRRLYADLAGALGQLDAALQSAGGAAEFRLGFPWLLPPQWLRSVLPAVERAIGIGVELLRRDEFLAGVDRGLVDAAVIHGTVSHPSLHAVELFDEPRIAVVPRSGPLARRRRLRWTEIAGHPLMVIGRDGTGTVGPHLWPDGERPEIAHEYRNFDEWLAAIAAGRGIGVAPHCAREYGHPSVTYVPIADAPPVPFTLVRPARGAHPLAERVEAAALAAVRAGGAAG